jgi:uncharacterized protein (DUF2235 family)
VAEKIIILSDGTGNAASSVWRTNVWRIFQSLDLQGNQQAAKYDDGVGTSSFVPLALLGGAFGWGLKRNVLDSYEFICRNYQPDSKLYLFGFSRGAFTARVLAAFILDQGLVDTDSEAERHDLARKAYRAYRANGYHSIWRIEVVFRALRAGLVKIADLLLRRPIYNPAKTITVPAIEFVGIWDTVAAYGLPVDEWTRGISNWIWPLELPNRVLSDKVQCARHALALDDERTTFHPVLWTEQAPGEPAPTISAATKDERLVQVWFVGMHANVGGGYPDDALAFVPLDWIFREAQRRGLVFKSEPSADPDSKKWIESSRDKDGRLYDSRSGLGAYYRYGPRKLRDICNDRANGVSVPIPKIHESVFGRIDSGANAYAPIGLPEVYATVKDNGDVLPPGQNPFESSTQAGRRAHAQELLWNYVWMRRLTYFASLAASLHLAAFWLFHNQNSQHEFESPIRMVSETVRLFDSFLPHALHWWTDWYASNPEWFLGGLIALVATMMLGSSLSSKISDSMRVIWQSGGEETPVPENTLHRAICRFRNSAPYQALLRVGKRHLLPFAFAVVTLWVVVTGASHFAFNVADSMGAFCTGTATENQVKVNEGIAQEARAIFDTNAPCFATGLMVKGGNRYEIAVTVTEPWSDSGIDTTPMGFRTSELTGSSEATFISAFLLRRVLFRPWFRLIARIGERGVDEYFLDPKHVNGSPATVFKDNFRAQRDGELFLYVNDAVVAFPWLSSQFYKNNIGHAKITLRLL